MKGELHKAPVTNPQKILDLGTGTGIWALDIAEYEHTHTHTHITPRSMSEAHIKQEIPYRQGNRKRHQRHPTNLGHPERGVHHRRLRKRMAVRERQLRLYPRTSTIRVSHLNNIPQSNKSHTSQMRRRLVTVLRTNLRPRQTRRLLRDPRKRRLGVER